MMQVTVFRRTGEAIGEIRPYVPEISWRINDFGRAKFTLAVTDSQAKAEFLQFGNRILIEFDNGLPNWGGVIDVPRDWGAGTVSCAAYSGEYLLNFRRTDKGRYFTDTPVGTIARRLVEEANAIRATGLTIGDIWVGGDLHSPDYHVKNLYDIFTQSLFSRLSTADFAVIPSQVNGRIVFTLNVYERRGADKPGVALHEGKNMTANSTLSEQGPIYNDVITVGDGQNWGDDRLTGYGVDQSSVELYGLRETGVMMSGVKSPITLQAGADTAIANNAHPHNLLKIEATDKKPGTFAQYDLGDRVAAEMPNYGFGGFRASVRVLGRAFYPERGVCDVVVREEV
ncbi:MAG: hypothetical protein KDE34_17765 [Anaerolineales bacterium]|nr:hypothetical protein [Anaerolineales bacterium]